MRFEGEFSVPGKPAVVIQRFADVERMARCMPGAVIEGRDEEGNYTGGMLVAFGPKKIKFKGRVAVETDAAALTGSLRGRGAADMRAARIEVRISYALRDDPAVAGATLVKLTSDAELGGVLADFARTGGVPFAKALMQDFSRRVAEEFATDAPVQKPAGEPVPLAAHGLLWQVIKEKLAQLGRWLGLREGLMDADYVVVGAGSAGCVIASRLSETGASVTLLEAGPRDWHPMIHIPAGVLKLLHHPVVNWNYSSAPETGTAGRSIHWPRGKVLGGSSSINGMLYVRGNPADFDGWAQMGCRGWSFDDVLPYLRKSEHYVQGGDAEYRGEGGPLRVEDYRTILPLTHRFVEAAQQVGFPFSSDLNGKMQEGVGYSQMTRKGRFRGSTAQTFLAAAKSRENLRIETDAMATRLLFDGKRCTGVAFRQRGIDHQALAAREVILCGGSVNSPHLLQISGIGAAEYLQSIGVAALHDLPGVGANLQDHYVARISHRAKDATSINQLAHGIRLAGEAVRFVATGRGALTFGVTSAQVFCRSRTELASPDLQLLFTPASYDAARFGQLEHEAGMTVAVCPVRPDSRGTIMARSPDPFAAPLITPNYLSDPNDQRVLNAGIRITRNIFAAPAIAQHSVVETLPGRSLVSDDELADYSRRFGTTIFHPVGTCRMGEGPNAVVDARLRVHGMGGLRVIDASVMPTLTTGNTNAPTIMIAEKGAAMIREDAAA